MAKILHIETVTDRCSVALGREGALVAIKESEEPHAHARVITLLIQEALAEAGWQLAELDAVAVSAGPGSYTGLRVGVSTAKGICFALQKPLIAVPTLLALADAASRQHTGPALFVPLIDARRMEVYTAVYDSELREKEPVQAKVMDDTAFQSYFEAGQVLVFCGDGLEKCKALFPPDRSVFLPLLCSAAHLLSLAEKAWADQAFEDLAYFEPFYLKPPNITRSKKKIL